MSDVRCRLPAMGMCVRSRWRMESFRAAVELQQVKLIEGRGPQYSVSSMNTKEQTDRGRQGVQHERV